MKHHKERNIARLSNIRRDGYNNRENEITLATVKRFPFPLRNREFCNKMIWRKIDNDTVSVAWVPITGEKRQKLRRDYHSKH